MKPTLFDPATQTEMLGRIRQLTASTTPLWGKMTVGQAVCHMADPFRDVLNIRQTKPVVPALLRPLVRLMVLTEKPWKPNLTTLKPYSQDEGGGGTRPTNFESDHKTLLDLVQQFCATGEDYAFGLHAGMGRLGRAQNGFMMWKHLDHHLRQFGV